MRSAGLWISYTRRPVRVELLEIVGPLPKGVLGFAWLCFRLGLGLKTGVSLSAFEVAND